MIEWDGDVEYDDGGLIMSESNRPDEAELLAYMEQVHDLELDGERREVAFGPYTALVVIGMLQLATRHPGITDRQRVEVGAVVDQFRPWFAGTPGEHIIDMGNDPELDR